MRERELTASFLPALIAGEQRVGDRLYEVWGPIVLRWCARLGGPRINEEDAAHDVFEHVFTHLHALRDPRAFPPWLFSATRRVVSDHRRRAWLRRWLPGFTPDVPDPDAEHRVERDDTARAVRAAIDSLAADLREVLVLCEIEERNATEVADLLGLPLGTVKSRLRKARQRFEVEARKRGLAGALEPIRRTSTGDEDCG